MDPRQSPRLDFIAKVTGQAEFVSDVVVPNMLQGKILRSPSPHGEIASIDASEALALPGVVAVLTGKDISQFNTHWGLFLKDRPLIAMVVGNVLAVINNFLLVRTFVYRFHPEVDDPE